MDLPTVVDIPETALAEALRLHTATVIPIMETWLMEKKQVRAHIYGLTGPLTQEGGPVTRCPDREPMYMPGIPAHPSVVHLLMEFPMETVHM